MAVDCINGTTLFHEVTGSGEPLVLVHGAWVDHTTWDQVVPLLAESFQVVTYDLRGHGRSHLEPPDAGTVHDDVADLAALVEHLDLGAANLVGISSGACIALRVATEHPDVVASVVAHEPPCLGLVVGDPEAKPMLDSFGELIAAVYGRIESGDHRGAAELFFDEGVREPWSRMSPPLQECLASHAVAFLGQLRDADAIALAPDDLATISMPVLLSQGAQSPDLPKLVAEQVAALIPGSRRAVVADAGHVPHMTHPDAFVAVITAFVRST
jgi:pimeloyl-ACP methyl ester carboxylesterase